MNDPSIICMQLSARELLKSLPLLKNKSCSSPHQKKTLLALTPRGPRATPSTTCSARQTRSEKKNRTQDAMAIHTTSTFHKTNMTWPRTWRFALILSVPADSPRPHINQRRFPKGWW